MSFWKRLFGSGNPHQDTPVEPPPPVDRDLDSYLSVSNSEETRRIDALVSRAQEFYPHGDTDKALRLFRQAIALASPAPPDKSTQESRDLTAIGDAFWMAWVCLDLLERSEAEVTALLAEARVKSPVTAVRIEERLSEAREKAESQRKSELATATLENAVLEDPTTLGAAVQTLAVAGEWWALRDAGVALIKQQEYDVAWEALDKALAIATRKTGNIPSIYCAMGDLRKAQERHADAARCYLKSCLSAGQDPLKRAVDQLRISLKKAGISGDAGAIRDELLAMRTVDQEAAILARLSTVLVDTTSGQQHSG